MGEVQSEKTAIIAQGKIPDYIWLATGSLNEFKPSKLEILKNRIVVAFPDLGALDIWKNKASEKDFMSPFQISWNITQPMNKKSQAWTSLISCKPVQNYSPIFIILSTS